MTTWHPEGGNGEVLSLGREAPRSARTRVGVIALVCLALGVLLGTQVDDAVERRTTRESGPPPLVAGVIQENPDPADERRFAVPVHNGGTVAVNVGAVTAEGWVSLESGSEAVTIRPGEWLMLPLRAQIDCAVVGAAAPERLTVRTTTVGGTGEVRQELRMPAASRPLQQEGTRLCDEPSGSVPSAQEVVGTWYVEEAGADRGTLLKLRPDGTFAIDPDLFRFGSALDALGSFHLSGGTLWLTARGGHDCRPGEDTRWQLTLLEDGRLHIRHQPGRTRWCGIETGEVWIARRA